jgi:hypothetical protein
MLLPNADDGVEVLYAEGKRELAFPNAGLCSRLQFAQDHEIGELCVVTCQLKSHMPRSRQRHPIVFDDYGIAFDEPMPPFAHDDSGVGRPQRNQTRRE